MDLEDLQNEVEDGINDDDYEIEQYQEANARQPSQPSQPVNIPATPVKLTKKGVPRKKYTITEEAKEAKRASLARAREIRKQRAEQKKQKYEFSENQEGEGEDDDAEETYFLSKLKPKKPPKASKASQETQQQGGNLVSYSGVSRDEFNELKDMMTYYVKQIRKRKAKEPIITKPAPPPPAPVAQPPQPKPEPIKNPVVAALERKLINW